jgi:hypothetical protein
MAKAKKKSIVQEINPLGVDLVGKLVRLRQSFFKPGMNASDWLFRCEGGFGCDPAAMGTKVFGRFVRDGEQCHIRRDQIDAIVPESQANTIIGA